MRVFVAGASGALGSRLAKPVKVDLLDPRSVRKAVLEARPDAIVYQATALSNAKFGRNLDKMFAKTNELRTKGTDALLAAAREAGVRRFVAQSYASYRYAREGGPVKAEDDPLDEHPPAHTQEMFAAMRYLRSTTSSTTSPLRSVTGYRSTPRRWERSLPVRCRSGWHRCSSARPAWSWAPRRAAPPTPRPSASSAGPRYPSWRKGFKAAYAAITVADAPTPSRPPEPANRLANALARVYR